MSEQDENDDAARRTQQVLGPFGYMSVLVLNTVGARSGQARPVSLTYVADGDDFVVIAANGGAARHPAWYHNLLANPETTVEVGGERIAVTAVVVVGDTERADLLRAFTAEYPQTDFYQSGTTRQFPVVRLKATASQG